MLSCSCSLRYSRARTPSTVFPLTSTWLSFAAKMVAATGDFLLILYTNGCVDIVDGTHWPDRDVDPDDSLGEILLGRVDVDEEGRILAVGGRDEGALALHAGERRHDLLFQ